jgi:phosphoenolpyruvate carboxylase
MKRFFTTDHGQITTDITEKGGPMGTKESVGKVLKKAVRILPGVGSYQDKESLRESDKKLRDHISTQLSYCIETIERLKTGISRKGSLSFLKDLDDISRQMDTLSRTITFASRGYSGVFDSNLVDEKALSHLFEFDQSFQKEVDLLRSLVAKISKKNKELDSTMLNEVWDHLLKIKKRINEREKLLKGPSD